MPANKDFENGFVCGSISDVDHANNVQLMAECETGDVLEMLVFAHRAGSNGTFSDQDRRSEHAHHRGLQLRLGRART